MLPCHTYGAGLQAHAPTNCALAFQGKDGQGSASESGSKVEEQSLIGESITEMEAARSAGFIPICATAEAAALSRQHQPPLTASGSTTGATALGHATWVEWGLDGAKRICEEVVQILSGKGVRTIWVALEWAPRLAAKLLFKAVPEEVFLVIAEGIPGADAVIMAAKRLSKCRGWVPGRTFARWQLHESRTHALQCQ